MAYTAEKQKTIRHNKKNNLEIIRLLIDVLEENPTMTFAHLIRALDLHKVSAEEMPEQTLETIKKNIYQLYLIKTQLD
jgi:hypothetical protein